jgi:mannosyltransferase PIG-V
MLKSTPDMAHQANQRALFGEALRAAWAPFWITRVAIAVVAVVATLAFGPAHGAIPREHELHYDEPALTHPLGGALSPLARWDAVWYLRIADSGYKGAEPRTAFFPLYPLLVRGLGELGGGSPAARLVSAYLIALAAFLAALVLLWELVALELGRPLAGPTVVLLAVFPGALYFGAPYSESVFLLASVGAFYAARTDRWAWAGAATFAAAATRSVGVLLLVPLAVIWWQQRERRIGQLAWLGLGPLAVALYALFLGLTDGDALGFLQVQDAWFRHATGPFVGAWDGIVAGFDGARQLLSGSRSPVYWRASGADPFRTAWVNLMLLATLVFALAGAVGTWRRLPRAYGAWVATALLLPLSFPVRPQPLMSLPRFVAVLFPIFMWLALATEDRRWTPRVAVIFALLLGIFTFSFATWHWVA